MSAIMICPWVIYFQTSSLGGLYNVHVYRPLNHDIIMIHAHTHIHVYTCVCNIYSPQSYHQTVALLLHCVQSQGTVHL